jgi:hypothetical protein
MSSEFLFRLVGLLVELEGFDAADDILDPATINEQITESRSK